MATQTQITSAKSQRREILREIKVAMQAHQTNLRLDINDIEVLVGCIAKSTDEEVMRYLPEANLSISSLRECLLTLQVHWNIYEIKQRNLDGV